MVLTHEGVNGVLGLWWFFPFRKLSNDSSYGSYTSQTLAPGHHVS